MKSTKVHCPQSYILSYIDIYALTARLAMVGVQGTDHLVGCLAWVLLVSYIYPTYFTFLLVGEHYVHFVL